jgi:hypothetical protein
MMAATSAGKTVKVSVRARSTPGVAKAALTPLSWRHHQHEDRQSSPHRPRPHRQRLELTVEVGDTAEVKITDVWSSVIHGLALGQVDAGSIPQS